MKKTSLMAFTAGHFLVDLSCGYILYAMYTADVIDPLEVGGLFMLYNLLAFATQHLFGVIADRIVSGGRSFAVVGIAATAIGLFIGNASPIATVCLVGLGNASFHIGGGIDSLTQSRGMTRAGIFVSSGALGVALGCKLGEKDFFEPFHFIALLSFAAIAIYLYCDCERRVIEIPQPSENEKGTVSAKTIISTTLPSLMILLLAVLIRSYAGVIAIKPESDSSLIVIVTAGAAFAGKFAGGIFADLLGARRVGTLSLLIAMPLFVLGATSSLCFIVATFFFNVAMPITLVSAARRLPRHEGFVFGLTALAIFVGYFINAVVPISADVATILLPVITLIAAACVFLTTDDIRIPSDK